MMTSCTSRGVPRMIQMYRLAKTWNGTIRLRPMSAIIRPSTVARAMETTEMTTVSASPLRNCGLGVSRLCQKYGQSKFMRFSSGCQAGDAPRHPARSDVQTRSGVADVLSGHSPFLEDLRVGAILDESVERRLERLVQVRVLLERRGADLDRPDGLADERELSVGLQFVVPHELGGVHECVDLVGDGLLQCVCGAIGERDLDRLLPVRLARRRLLGEEVGAGGARDRDRTGAAQRVVVSGHACGVVGGDGHAGGREEV